MYLSVWKFTWGQNNLHCLAWAHDVNLLGEKYHKQKFRSLISRLYGERGQKWNKAYTYSLYLHSLNRIQDKTRTEEQLVNRLKMAQNSIIVKQHFYHSWFQRK